MMNWLFGIAILFAIAGLAIWLVARRNPNLAAEFARQLDAAQAHTPSSPGPLLTEEQIAPLPLPVQRYIRATGSIGKPRIRSMKLVFAAEMFRKPGQAGMSGEAEQFDRLDPPKRLFFMRSRMFGLPVMVLHDYDDTRASMTVRLASLLNVADIHSDELARIETVTLLNDVAFFAPSWFADQRFAWQTVDDTHVEVTFTNGPHRVTATLIFNTTDDLVNFISDDRAVSQDDGSFRYVRWSTPMRAYREMDGRRVPTQGEAIWHYPEGDFVYGRFTLKSYNAR